MTEAGAIAAAAGAVLAGGAGLVLLYRSARGKGRRAAISEADDLELELSACRKDRLDDRRRIYELETVLASRGLEA